jgi:hypothetical protein
VITKTGYIPLIHYEEPVSKMYIGKMGGFDQLNLKDTPSIPY